uniref:Uncharacterized protein n=1 Tax=Arundo donax TaxID=35708 RepID=A0A0A9CZT6_ARUDO
MRGSKARSTPPLPPRRALAPAPIRNPTKRSLCIHGAARKEAVHASADLPPWTLSFDELGLVMNNETLGSPLQSHPEGLAVLNENELVQLKHEAWMKDGFYADPEAKLHFLIRICGTYSFDELGLVMNNERLGSALTVAITY